MQTERARKANEVKIETAQRILGGDEFGYRGGEASEGGPMDVEATTSQALGSANYGGNHHTYSTALDTIDEETE